MQRQVPDGVVIACDFCGTDWDQQQPMVEGHRGSVICLECLKSALAQAVPAAAACACVLCLRTLPAGTPQWAPTPRPPAGNPQARICRDCIAQAAGVLDRDPEVPWRRPAGT